MLRTFTVYGAGTVNHENGDDYGKNNIAKKKRRDYPKKQEKGLFIFASKLPRLFCVYADTGNYRAGLQSDGL
ncbi:hypothetical protein F210042A8_39190 [Blautia parvula]